jgi:hypothetical protein
MARIIPFYIPSRFHKPERWVPPQQRGRVLPFRRMPRKLSEQEWRILGITGRRSSYFKIPGA